MDAISRSSLSATDMPYVIIFGVLLFVGMVASCVLVVSSP